MTAGTIAGAGVQASPGAAGRPRRTARRLDIFVTHPIQYFAPLWRELARTPGLDLAVHFFSDHSVRGDVDPGFGVKVAWDVPVLEGYEHRFLSRTADLSRPGRVGLPEDPFAGRRPDAVLVHGYTFRFERQVVRRAKARGATTLLRGELTDAARGNGRGLVRGVLREGYLRWFYRFIDRFCVIGEEARAHLRRRGVPDDRMFFSPYSVDSALFDAQKARFPREQARADLGIREGDVAFLFSGKLIPRKAPLLITEALRRMPSRERCHLVVVGDGELRGPVEAEARALLGPRLTMAGFVNQSQLGKYYAAADVFLFPSVYETWGLVLNEAMQFGLPAVVSSRVGSHRDLVVEGQTGFTFPAGDAGALARHMEQLAGDPALRRELGRKAEAHVRRYDTAASAAGVREALGLA